MKKFNTSYSKIKNSKKKRKKYLTKLLMSSSKKISFQERIVKFFIYIALRLVTKPSKWKNPEKNYEIIDRTYKKIISSDFIFIPSSIAFYLVVAFMPIMSLILFLYQIPIMHNFIMVNNKNMINEILSHFIPGISSIIDKMNYFVDGTKKYLDHPNIPAFIFTLISLVISCWIASSGFSKLVFTESHIYKHKYLGGFWMNKLKGFFIVVSFTIFLFILLTTYIFWFKIIDILNLSNILELFIKKLFLFFWVFLGLLLGFILFYKFSPRFKISFKNVLPGAMVSTIPTTLFLFVFGYIASLFSYGKYGILGTVMYVSFFSLILTYFIFVGIIANASYYKTFVNKKVKNKWTISKK